MNQTSSWKVRLKGEGDRLGDASRFEFEVNDLERGEFSTLFVKVSRSLIDSEEFTGDPKSLAANSVNLHLLEKLHDDDYVNGEILITSYSSHKDELVGTYEEFVVESSDRGMGFIL